MKKFEIELTPRTIIWILFIILPMYFILKALILTYHPLLTSIIFLIYIVSHVFSLFLISEGK